MDLKYLLCEPVSKLVVKATEQAALIQQQRQQQQQFGFDWHANSTSIYSSVITKGQEWNNANINNMQSSTSMMMIGSPKSICSSISTCSSVSTNSGDEYNNNNNNNNTPGRSRSFSSLPPKQQQQQHPRRRTASDVSLTRHHMFIYSHPNSRPRSESAGNNNNNNVQTRTPWTPYEDHLLQQGYDQGLSWAMISSSYLPHRSRGCCWGRFKTLQNKNMVDPTHSHMRHFRRPWKAIDFNNNKKISL